MADYGMEDMVSELNQEAAKLARSVADSYERPVLVAGVLGPTNRTRSISPMLTIQVLGILHSNNWSRPAFTTLLLRWC